MTTKTCKQCGWVLDVRDPNTRCPICKTRFTEGLCRICGEFLPYYSGDRCVCRDCYLHVTKKPDDDRRLNERRKAVYKEWLAKIARVPKAYPTLTEAQWLAACKHFEGCACCGNDSVDARGYFVPFRDGGRYCDWNIIPMCERCATAARINGSMFATSSRPARLVDIINYLEDKLNAASKN